MQLALNRVFRKLTLLFRRRQFERELMEELQAHAAFKEQEIRARALPPEETRKQMGNLTLAKEESRDVWTFSFLQQTFKDLRYALRTFAKNPAFTATALVSLALGIAGNIAIFSFINALLLRPLPYPQPDRLLSITEFYPKAVLVYFEQQCRTMEIASVSPGSEFNLTGRGPAIRLVGSETSTNFFSVLGTAVERGRAFEVNENRPGQDAVVVINHELWMREFDGNPDAIGATITLNGVNRRIIGIAPATFDLPSSKVQFWIPGRLDPSNLDEYWGGEYVPLIARLRPGANIAQARAEIHSLVANLWKLFPFPMPRHWNADSTVIPLQTDLAGESRSKLLLLLCAVGTVLLIACANVASLLLSRARTRGKEIAMRVALGAGRFRIVRQLLTESVLLAFCAAGIGLFAGTAALSLFRSVLPSDLPGMAFIRIDWHVAGFAVTLAILTGLSFGIAPAMNAARIDVTGLIKSSGQKFASKATAQLRSWLIAGEVALTVILVVGAGLLLRSLFALSEVNPGFSPQRILAVTISPNQSFCAQRASCISFYERLLDHARGVSGVVDAALANTLPMDGELPSIPADVEDHPRSADFPSPMLWVGAITSDYLRLMHIPLLAGRAFTRTDGANSAAVVLITASTAKRFWPHENPIGKHIKSVWDKDWRTVIGVVADVRQFNLANHSPQSISGAVYMPYAQSVSGDKQIPAVMNLLVRTGFNSPETAAEIRQIALDEDPNVPVGKIVPLTEIVSGSISGLRSTIWVFLSFAAAALILAAIGIYGLVSYSVTQRTYEIGVRMAIGASRANVIRLIVGQSLAITLAGLLAGVIGSLLVTRFLSGLLFGVAAVDPLTFACVCTLLIVVAVLASCLPAARAVRINPVRTLRAE